MADSTGVKAETIASSGDVILIVGEPAQLKLTVASTTLASASQVFAALLGPKYLEGQSIGSSERPKEIALPEDDAIAMSDMCHLLHGKQVVDFLGRPQSDRILDFAIVVDKYACADALRIQSQAILYANILYFTEPDFELYSQRIVAAYLLDHYDVFKMVTGRLIAETSGDILGFLDTAWGSFLPAKVLYALERKRLAAQQKIVFDLPRMPHLGNRKIAHGPVCCYYSTYMTALCEAFKIKQWPPNCMTGGTITVKTSIDKLVAFNFLAGRIPCGLGLGGEYWEPITLVGFVDGLKKMCEGLCLVCARSSKVDLSIECTEEDHAGSCMVTC